MMKSKGMENKAMGGGKTKTAPKPAPKPAKKGK